MRLKADPAVELAETALGTGTKLKIEKSKLFLDAHQDDVVFLSQENETLSVTVDGVSIQLNQAESANLVVRSNPASVVADNSVTILVKGLTQRPADHPKSTSKSAGFSFRGVYRKWQINKTFKSNKN